MKDSLSVINEMTKQGVTTGQDKTWIAVAVICSIAALLALLYRFQKLRKKHQIKREVIEETAQVDISTVTHNWKKAKQLYDVLKRDCHPDKFGADKQEDATRIFQLVMQNKYKYQELLAVKQEAAEKLGIVFGDD